MKKIGLLLAVFVTIACSGNGVDVEPSPFQGKYKGTWTGQGGGTAEVEIADDGSFTGKSHSYSYNMEGVLTGVIKNNGNVTLSVTYPGQEPINGSGEWSFNEENHLVGTVNINGGNVTYYLEPFIGHF
jgi:small nuclear ribonucleoprotein (snRNP)-like protein